MNKLLVSLIFILTFLSCRDKNDYFLSLNKSDERNISLGFPKKINIKKVGNFVVINKAITDSLVDNIILFERDGMYYTLDYQYDDSWNYVGMNRSLFLRNSPKDSCFSVDKGYLEFSKMLRKQIMTKDFCFNKVSKNKFKTIIQYLTEENEYLYETYFYDKNYYIKKIVIKYGDKLFTYK